jgi:hypothetical protein
MNILETRFGGVIKSGKHNENGECCIFEYASVLKGISWTDLPQLIRCVDIRPLNDARWSSDELRTEWMIKVYDALEGSLDWPKDKLQTWITNVIISLVKEIISELPGLNIQIKKQCKVVTNLREAAGAARAVRTAYAATAVAAAAAADAADAAYAATAVAAAAAAADAYARAAAYADTAYAAADAAAYADAYAVVASDKVLIKCCQIWINSVQS